MSIGESCVLMSIGESCVLCPLVRVVCCVTSGFGEELCVIRVLPAVSAVQGAITPPATIFVRLEISTSLTRSLVRSLAHCAKSVCACVIILLWFSHRADHCVL